MTARATRLRKARLGTGVLAVALLAPATGPAVAGAQDPGEEQENDYEGGSDPGAGEVGDLTPGQGSTGDIVEEEAALPGDNDDPSDGLDEDGPVETDYPAIGDELPATPAPPPVAPTPPTRTGPRAQTTPPAAPQANTMPAPRSEVAPMRREPQDAQRPRRRRATNVKLRQRRTAPAPARGRGSTGRPQPGPSAGGGSTAPGAGARVVAKSSASGRTHTVRAGETLWSIAAARLGAGASAAQIAREVQRLWNLNASAIGTGDPSLIGVGVVLRLR